MTMMQREIVLDTETTGLDPLRGDRVVEIGCVELHNRVPTGRTFQRYLNPERDMSEDAFRVHGLSTAFLAGHRTFAEEADAFLAFIGDAPLVIHNADFDMRFVNAELRRIGRPELARERAVDTVQIARRKFPGAQASLDALCRRFEVDTSARTHHGALLDAQLLAAVYLELTGGRQPGFELAPVSPTAVLVGDPAAVRPGHRAMRPPRPHAPTASEAEAHAHFVATIKDAIWRR